MHRKRGVTLKLYQLKSIKLRPTACAGDGEGANEMNLSLGFLRQYLRIFQDRAAATRIFFPDEKVCPLTACSSPCTLPLVVYKQLAQKSAP